MYTSARAAARQSASATGKHSTDILFTTSKPRSFGDARRLIGVAIADRRMRAEFGAPNTTHGRD